MTLCTFFNAKPWFLQVLQLFQFLVFNTKRANHCESYVKFQDFKRFLKSVLNSDIHFIHVKSFTDNFFDITHPYKFYLPIFRISWFFIFIIISHVFLAYLILINNSMNNSMDNSMTFFYH